MAIRLPVCAGLFILLACASSNGPAQPRVLAGPVAAADCLVLTPADTVWPVDSLDYRPEALAVVPPIYPRELQSRAVEGKVVFVLRVQPTGRVDPCSLQLVEEHTPGFAQAARVSVLSTYFQVPKRSGKPVFATIRQSIAFRVH
jgi:outer membrane biosynthesis protein TonB